MIRTGIDIIEIDRVQKIIEKKGSSFIDKVFTRYEQEYCESRKAAKYESYAARFAAKEAFAKALGTGFSKGIKLTDIEVYNNQQGLPEIRLYGMANRLFRDFNFKQISLSLSHCKCHAVASVIIY